MGHSSSSHSLYCTEPKLVAMWGSTFQHGGALSFGTWCGRSQSLIHRPLTVRYIIGITFKHHRFYLFETVFFAPNHFYKTAFWTVFTSQQVRIYWATPGLLSLWCLVWSVPLSLLCFALQVLIRLLPQLIAHCSNLLHFALVRRLMARNSMAKGSFECIACTQLHWPFRLLLFVSWGGDRSLHPSSKCSMNLCVCSSQWVRAGRKPSKKQRGTRNWSLI